MAGVEQGAAQGEQVAGPDGKLLGQGHQPHPDHTQQGGGDVVPVGFYLHHGPGEKGDDHAVHRCQKGVFGGGGQRQAKGLYRVGQKQKSADDRPTPQVVGRKVPPFLPGCQAQQHGPGGKTDGQKEKYRHDVQGVFHDKKGGAPDEGGGEQHGFCQEAHGFWGHGYQLQIAKLGLGW